MSPEPASHPDDALLWKSGIKFERPDPPEIKFGFRANDGTQIDAGELPGSDRPCGVDRPTILHACGTMTVAVPVIARARSQRGPWIASNYCGGIPWDTRVIVWGGLQARRLHRPRQPGDYPLQLDGLGRADRPPVQAGQRPWCEVVGGHPSARGVPAHNVLAVDAHQAGSGACVELHGGPSAAVTFEHILQSVPGER